MIIVIVGPTGVGKTKLSIEIAKHFNAEIINADSVQIYKEPNIVSAKIKEENKEGIKHHLLSIKSLKENNTIYDFQKEGRRILDELLSENKNVVIVGGSGLYLKALLYDYKLSDENIINNTYEDFTNKELKDKVIKIDPNNKIHENNRKRLIRFLNHYERTGKIIENKEERNKKLYDFKTVGLYTTNEILYDRINMRVEEMINEGLIDEAKTLYDMKYPKLDQIIGYKELIPYFSNECSLEEAIDNIKRDTRKYSKRQYTWYRNQFQDINWFMTNFDNFEETIKKVISHLI